MFKLHFNSIEEFLAMGGHGFYVWICYGVVLFSLVFYFYYSKHKEKQRIDELKKFYQRLDLNSNSKD